MSTIYKDKNITKMYYGSTPVYSFSVEDGGGTGGDTTNYSYLVPTADVEGLKALGWDDESIGYYRDNNLCPEWIKDDFKVSEENIALLGMVNRNNYGDYKKNPNMVYLPKFDLEGGFSPFRDSKYLKAIPYFEFSWKNASFSFYGCSQLITIPPLKISGVTDMTGMFGGCSSLITIPPLDTSNITNMTQMFHSCSSLKAIPPLDTSNVTSMNGMFNGCVNLSYLPHLNTDNVIDMTYMFQKCSSLTKVSLSNTGKITNMQWMFQNCSSLQTISGLNTSNVTNMYGMFDGCSSLTTIPSIDTSNVTNMYSLFNLCSNLITIPEIDTSKVTNVSSMFSNCYNLESLPLLDFSSVTTASYIFGWSNYNKLTDIGGFKNLKISITSYFLDYCPNLTIESLMNVINNLYDLTANGLSGKSLKFGSTNLNKLTTEQVAIATAKGWTLTA